MLKDKLVFGNNNKKTGLLGAVRLKRTAPGFGFIELVIVLAIMGILAATVLPNFKRLWPGYQRREFIDHMNSLMQVTWHSAIVTSKLHKVIFDLEKRKIWVEMQGDKKPNHLGEAPFVPIKSDYMNTRYEWEPETFDFKNFYIAKRDEISLTLRGKGGKIWFFVTPEGLAQPVILNIYDLKEKVAGQRGTEFALVLNPFLVQFKAYENFQKPE